jgi:hypothetical protein
MSEARHSFAPIPLPTFACVESPLGRGIWAGEFQQLGIGMSNARHSETQIPVPALAKAGKPSRKGEAVKG